MIGQIELKEFTKLNNNTKTNNSDISLEWLYVNTPDNSARFVLGTKGENPLVCFGINPSTAEPNNLDPTVNLVSRIAVRNDYDSFIMFNVYPQRATDPDNLHTTDPTQDTLPQHVQSLIRENLFHISQCVNFRDLTIWAAWGALITKRPYLLPTVKLIAELPLLRYCDWVSRGPLTKDGHPHHPLYVKKDVPLEPFDINGYIEEFIL